MVNDSEVQAPAFTKPLVRVLKSDSFLEKALLLVVAALLSGLLAPLVVKSIDKTREGREAVSNAQAKLFDDFSETLLACETLALDVSWFGTKAAKNSEMQKRAFTRYSERVVDLTAKWRAESSRAQVLASAHVSKKLDHFQTRFFSEQDTPLNHLWSTCGTECDWQQFHEKNIAMLAEANALIVELASDLGFAKRR